MSESSRQNEVIISLLGRIAFPETKLRNIITTKKRNPQAYVKGYNACDGTHTVTEIANIVGVSPSTTSEILKTWNEIGIIYEVDRPNGRFYKNLYPIR